MRRKPGPDSRGTSASRPCRRSPCRCRALRAKPPDPSRRFHVDRRRRDAQNRNGSIVGHCGPSTTVCRTGSEPATTPSVPSCSDRTWSERARAVQTGASGRSEARVCLGASLRNRRGQRPVVPLVLVGVRLREVGDRVVEAPTCRGRPRSRCGHRHAHGRERVSIRRTRVHPGCAGSSRRSRRTSSSPAAAARR